MANNDWFLKEEYLALQKEIEGLLGELRQNERNCVIAVVLSFAWVATQDLNPNLQALAWFLPSVVPIFGAIRGVAIEKTLQFICQYLKTVELAVTPGLGVVGWQHYLDLRRPVALVQASRIFWVVLVLLSLVVSMYGAKLEWVRSLERSISELF